MTLLTGALHEQKMSQRQKCLAIIISEKQGAVNIKGFIKLIKGTRGKTDVENKILAELEEEVQVVSTRTAEFIQQLPLDTRDREQLNGLIDELVKTVSTAAASRGLYLKEESQR